MVQISRQEVDQERIHIDVNASGGRDRPSTSGANVSRAEAERLVASALPAPHDREEVWTIRRRDDRSRGKRVDIN